jgi:hypothetical protein
MWKGYKWHFSKEGIQMSSGYMKRHLHHQSSGVYSTLHHCDKITEKSNLKEYRLILIMFSEASPSHWLAPMLWTWAKPDTCWNGMAEQNCSPHRNQEAKSGKKQLGTWYIFQRDTLGTYFLQPVPTSKCFQQLLIMTSNYESIIQ